MGLGSLGSLGSRLLSKEALELAIPGEDLCDVLESLVASGCLEGFEIFYETRKNSRKRSSGASVKVTGDLLRLEAFLDAQGDGSGLPKDLKRVPIERRYYKDSEQSSGKPKTPTIWRQTGSAAELVGITQDFYRQALALTHSRAFAQWPKQHKQIWLAYCEGRGVSGLPKDLKCTPGQIRGVLRKGRRLAGLPASSSSRKRGPGRPRSQQGACLALVPAGEEACARKPHAKGLCSKHYLQAWAASRNKTASALVPGEEASLNKTASAARAGLEASKGPEASLNKN